MFAITCKDFHFIRTNDFVDSLMRDTYSVWTGRKKSVIDSVMEKMQADTVYATKWSYVYRNKLQADSVFVKRMDTVNSVVEIICIVKISKRIGLAKKKYYFCRK